MVKKDKDKSRDFVTPISLISLRDEYKNISKIEKEVGRVESGSSVHISRE